jgi:small subunit ribosomal protein S3
MGQKVSPIGLRVGIIKDWDSKWYASKLEVPALLHEDIKIRETVHGFYKRAQISKIIIERVKTKVVLTIFSAKPGVVIGREGSVKNQIVDKLQKMTGKTVFLNVIEIKQPDLDATLVARRMAEELENRASFRRVQKKAIQQSMRSGAKGIKTMVSGRLGGAEMARSEGYSEGTVPLHTLRADIDYAIAEANTTYGKLGVKVWICKGEVLPAKKEAK